MFAAAGIEVVYPVSAVQHELVHAAIYDTGYGIKAFSDPITEQARRGVLEAARHLLQEQDTDALVLGCTELPLVIRSESLFGKPVIDPTLLLARALVRKAAPEKLRPEPQPIDAGGTGSCHEHMGG
jgi:aspartate racemase